MDAQELWATHFAERFYCERLKEDARREQAFLDLSIEVCGESLRVMTPQDLLFLHGAESPLVCAGEVTAEDLAFFLWFLHEKNDQTKQFSNRLRRSAFLRRLVVLPFAPSVQEARAYVDEIFQDAPTGNSGEARPLGTCFLAPLVVCLAVETGWSQREILTTPLPRLFQYQKVLRSRLLGKDFVDFSPSDRVKDEFLVRLNSKN
jgi:hypothetical protein